MFDILVKLTPIILTYVLGIILRRVGVLKQDDGAVLLKIVFYIALPALILLSIPDVEVTGELLVLPVIAVIIIFTSFSIAYLVFRRFVRQRSVFGVALVGSMIVNTGFIYPFALLAYGTEGFARTVIYDFGNATVVLTLVYYIACRYGENGQGSIGAIKRVLMSPPLWALATGFVLNAADITIHPHIRTFLSSVGNLMIPLVMLALGVYFSPRLVRWPLLVAVLVIRSGIGLLVALVLVSVFGLEGTTRSIVLICGASPVGYNTLVFSSIARLEVDFAASLLSTSIFLAILYLPLLLVVLQ